MRTCHTVVRLAGPPVSWPVRAPAFMGEPQRADAGIGGRSSAWRTSGHAGSPRGRAERPAQTAPGVCASCPHPQGPCGDPVRGRGVRRLARCTYPPDTKLVFCHPQMCDPLTPGNSRGVFHQFPGGFVSPMRAALYTRVSTHDQQTLAMQRDALQEFPPDAAGRSSTRWKRSPRERKTTAQAPGAAHRGPATPARCHSGVEALPAGPLAGGFDDDAP